MEGNIFDRSFDYEEDDYDKLSQHQKKKDKDGPYTNKSTRRKPEFDYEEDPYEP
jgi:hypothetical protein